MDGFKAFWIVLVFGMLYPDVSEAKMTPGKIDLDQDFAFTDKIFFGNEVENVPDCDIRFPSDYGLALLKDGAIQCTSFQLNEPTLTYPDELSQNDLPTMDYSCTAGFMLDDMLDCVGVFNLSWETTPRWLTDYTVCRGRGTNHDLPNLTYSKQMTNGKYGFFQNSKSTEKIDMEQNISVLVICLFVLAVTSNYYVCLPRNSLLHLTYKLIYLGLVSQMAAIILRCSGIYTFTRFGKRSPSVDAKMTLYLGKAVLTTILLLSFKVFSFTRACIGMKETGKVFGGVFSATYLVMLVYQFVVIDPRDCSTTTSAAAEDDWLSQYTYKTNPPKGGYKIFCVEKSGAVESKHEDRENATTSSIIVVSPMLPGAPDLSINGPVVATPSRPSQPAQSPATSATSATRATEDSWIAQFTYKTAPPKGGFSIFCVEKSVKPGLTTKDSGNSSRSIEQVAPVVPLAPRQCLTTNKTTTTTPTTTPTTNRCVLSTTTKTNDSWLAAFMYKISPSNIHNHSSAVPQTELSGLQKNKTSGVNGISGPTDDPSTENQTRATPTMMNRMKTLFSKRASRRIKPRRQKMAWIVRPQESGA